LASSVLILASGCYNIASAEATKGEMSVLWWLVGTVLIVLSLLLFVTGLQGREGMLQIGKVTVNEAEEAPRTQPRPVNVSNVVIGLVGILVGLAAILIFAV
jgi:hypothetical protein